MRINHNISAIRANRNLGITNKALDSSMEKLSSGYRITKAADDAAGLAISQKMRTQIRGLDQASRNASDGISVIQTAEGALSEVESMLQRMRVLAVQAANGTNTTEDCEALQAEIDQLNLEIERISNTTEFNTKTLLDGNLSNRTYNESNTLETIYLSDTVDPGDYEINVISTGSHTVTEFQLDMSVTEMPVAGTIFVNDQKIEIAKDESMDSVKTKLRDTCEAIKITTNFSADGKGCYFEAQAFGPKAVDVYVQPKELAAVLKVEDDPDTTVETKKGENVGVTLGDGFKPSATKVVKGDIVTITDVNGFEMQVKVGGAGTIKVLDAGPMDLQVGANEGQTMVVKIPNINPYTLGTDVLSVSSPDSAQAAITICDKAIQKVSDVRAKLGAYQNRLDYAIENLDLSEENMTEALSRIEDTDMASEMTEYTQKNVLAQAGNAMLAQANERPQTILSLLQA